MRVRIPNSIVDRLMRELKAARRREIGGILVAERLAGDEFMIADISVQRRGGSTHYFERDPSEHRAFLESFFEKTGHDYTRFNYFGEWHSHPNVDALPSITDVKTMQEIVSDPAVNTSFAVLLIARKRLFHGLELSATEFRSDSPPAPAELLAGDGSAEPKDFFIVDCFKRRQRFWS